MTQTRAIRIHKIGGPDVLTEEQITLNAPAAGQVLVRNTAIGLNFIDTYHRSGLYPVPLPFTLGSEGVGIVDAIGEGVANVQVGQRVGYFGAGAYAGHTLVAGAALVPLPDEVDDETAAAVLLKGLTCWMLLCEVHQASPGETALVWAAAGGVGSLLVPWATSLGMEVIAITGTESKVERIRKNGAAHVLLADDDIPARVSEITGGQGVDVAYDSVGKTSAESSLSSLRERGLFVSYGNASGAADPIAPTRLAQGGSLFMTRPTLFNYFNSPERMKRGAAALFGALKTGTIKADIGQRFALSDVADAHRALEGRKTVGATVLVP
ncbi:MAG: quinone oxidoreductase [Hyphomonadaceae bacterium]